MKKLLLAITFHEFDKEKIKFWNENLAVKVKEKFDVHFLFDFMISDEQKRFLNEWNFNYFDNLKNTGKLNLVFNFIRNNDFEEEFIKLIDPDDAININELFKFDEQISNLYGVNIIINSNYINNDGYIPFDKINVEKTKFSSMMANQCTILNVKLLKTWNGSTPLITKSSDTVLSFIATSRTKKVVKIDNNFYLYNYRNGISNPANLSIVDLKKYLSELQLFLDFFDKYKNLNYIREYPCSPGHMTLEWGWMAIKITEKNYFKKVIKVNKLYKLVLSTKRDNLERKVNINWNLWKRLRYIIL